MAISQGLLLWLLINLQENNVRFQQNMWRRSLESYSEPCPSQEDKELNSFLWYMDRNPPVYFFGTIHVPYTKVWDYIPSNSKRALKQANNVFFELDMTNVKNLRTLERCRKLPRGIKLQDVLPKSLYKRIKRHLSYIRGKFSKWLAFEQKFSNLIPLRLYQQVTKKWYKKRPIWIMMLLDKLTEYDVKLLVQQLPVLDTYLMRQAKQRLGSIETVEEQCDVLNKLDNEQVIMALNRTLIMHEKIRSGEVKQRFSTKQLIYHYNCGDLKDVLLSQDIASIANLENISEPNSLQKEQTKKFEEYMMEELFVKRNLKMANRIEKIAEEDPKRSMLFALGAGHFLGNQSIISILQSRGYKITHLKASDRLPRYGPNRKIKDCEKQKKRNGRRNSKNQKRGHYRKHCNNEISVSTPDASRDRFQVLPLRPQTTACTSCTTQGLFGLKNAPSSSTSIDGCQWSWFGILVLVLVIEITGV